MGQIRNYFFLLFQSICFISTPIKASLIDFQNLNQAIYGVDDRRFVDKDSSLKINELSKSIGLIVSSDLIDKKFFTSVVKAKKLSDKSGLNICLDEKFATHFSVNSCTGFLIGEDILVSAGHCFMSVEDCANKKIIFNVRLSSEKDLGYKVFNNSVYSCKEIIKSNFNSDSTIDYAVIRLNRKVSNALPLKVRTHGEISTKDQVFMIGHPLGLPLISTSNALVNDVSDPNFFKATLDSFEGNSGSPVINSKTFEVEGILVRGENDFIEDSIKRCNRNQVYNEGTINNPSVQGEGVSRINEIFPLEK